MCYVSVIVLFAAATQDPVGTAALVGNVENVIQSDPDLLYHHQGYMAFLASHPDAAEAERAYAELSQLSDFRRVTAAFDEAILGDAAGRAAFERYYVFLAEYPDARGDVDALFRVELGSARDWEALPDAFTYLRAHPDVALRFLDDRDALPPMQGSLEAARPYFADHPEVREELRSALLGIHDRGLAHVSAFPWWRMAADEESAVASAHAGLMGYMSQNPHKFWVWHRRQTALASDPRAQKWIPYWHARIRRHPKLKDAYWRYLRALRDRPEPLPGAATRGDATPPPRPWPPEGDPPRLPPLPPDKERKSNSLTREALMPKTVDRPSIPDLPVVTRPEGPTMPTSPDEPAAPQKPESSGDSWPETRGRGRSGVTAPVKPTPPTAPTAPEAKEESSRTRDASTP